jgi:neutral ceramidase
VSFTVSTAKVSIAPTLATNPHMGGYGLQAGARVASRSAPYREPLCARCVIIWDSGSPNAIISLDLLALPRSMHQAVRARLLPLAAWASSDIIIQVTHTHNGPTLEGMLDPFTAYALTDLTLVASYSAFVQNKIVEVVQTALKAAQTPVTLDYKLASARFAFNRARLPTTETSVPVLTARRSNGTARAVIFSYGCHPVSAGWQDLFDGDWPAGACSHVEASLSGCFALFLQGPCGDQDPTGVRGWALRDSHSTSIGSAVVSAARTAGRAVTGPIQSSYREVKLPLDITTTPANLAAVRACFVNRLSNPAGQPAWYQRHAQVMIKRIDSNQLETFVINPSQVWKLQGSPTLRIAMLGGELVSGYGAYFRNRYGGANGLLIGGYSGEVSCYVPADNFFPPFASGGSYEGGWDTDFPGIGGGSMTVYPHMAHFRKGVGGAEATLIANLNAQLV